MSSKDENHFDQRRNLKVNSNISFTTRKFPASSLEIVQLLFQIVCRHSPLAAVGGQFICQRRDICNNSNKNIKITSKISVLADESEQVSKEKESWVHTL